MELPQLLSEVFEKLMLQVMDRESLVWSTKQPYNEVYNEASIVPAALNTIEERALCQP